LIGGNKNQNELYMTIIEG